MQQQRLLDETNAKVALQQSVVASSMQSDALQKVPVDDLRQLESREQTSASAKAGVLFGKQKYGFIFRRPFSKFSCDGVDNLTQLSCVGRPGTEDRQLSGRFNKFGSSLDTRLNQNAHRVKVTAGLVWSLNEALKQTALAKN